MTRIRLGSRGSKLALTQSGMVAEMLRARHPGLSVEIVEIRTSGDRIQDVPLGPHLGQSFFTKEIEDALLEERIEVAVHSCKDLATALPDGLVLGAIPVREDPLDAWVSGGVPLDALHAGARVGTSSVRRKRFLAAARPDLEAVDLRGNVPTRLAAVEEGGVDAAVLAVAGLARLGLHGKITHVLGPEVMLPAAGQGALAVEVRGDDSWVRELVKVLDDPTARSEVTAERACLHRLGAGCQAPVGVLGRASAGVLVLHGAVAGPGGVTRVRVTGDAAEAEVLGVDTAESLLAQLGVTSLRGSEWAGAPPRRLEGET